jgi:hypothetical protein
MEGIKGEAAAQPAPFGLDTGAFDPGAARGWIAALPDFALGLTFLTAWIAPASLPAGTVQHLMLVMVLEFVIMHSSAFLGTVAIAPTARLGKIIAMLGLGGFYTLFVLSMSLAFHSWWPLGSFWGLMLNRLLGVMIGQAPSGEQKEFLRRTWACSAIVYLVGCALTVLAPIPPLGLTPGAVAALHLPGSGLWISQPYRVLAFGAFYFLAVAISELSGHAWLRTARPVTSPA